MSFYPNPYCNKDNKMWLVEQAEDPDLREVKRFKISANAELRFKYDLYQKLFKSRN